MVSYNDCEYIRELYQDFSDWSGDTNQQSGAEALWQRKWVSGGADCQLWHGRKKKELADADESVWNVWRAEGSSVWHGSSRKEDEDGSVSGDNGSAEWKRLYWNLIVLLAQTGIRTGEEVNLIYHLAAGEKDYRNESREFMLKRAEEDPLEELWVGKRSWNCRHSCLQMHTFRCRLGYCLLG